MVVLYAKSMKLFIGGKEIKHMSPINGGSYSFECELVLKPLNKSKTTMSLKAFKRMVKK